MGELLPLNRINGNAKINKLLTQKLWETKMKKLFILFVFTLFTLVGSANTVHAAGGITIDGKFDDWKNQPIQKWTTDNFTYHEVGLTADDKNLYLYVSMAPGNPGGYKKMMPTDYHVTINNHTYDLTLDVYSLLWSIQRGQSKEFNVGVWDGKNNKYEALKNAGYLSAEKAPGDDNQVMEAAIPLSTFGDDVNQSATFTLKNPTLGGQGSKITTTGASTKPYALAAIGAGIAGSGLVIYQRRKKREVANEK